METESIIEFIKESKSKSEVCRKMGISNNGNNFKMLDYVISENNIDISHFTYKQTKHVKKYEIIKKTCPVCGTEFETKKGHKKEKTVCSRSCSNTYFRSGKDNPNYKDITEYTDKRSVRLSKKYREICFENHKHECVVCGENKILDVHHYDGDKFNNSPENLIPICATHHNYIHSKYKDEVIGDVIKYRNNFIKNMKNTKQCD